MGIKNTGTILREGNESSYEVRVEAQGAKGDDDLASVMDFSLGT